MDWIHRQLRSGSKQAMAVLSDYPIRSRDDLARFAAELTLEQRVTERSVAHSQRVGRPPGGPRNGRGPTFPSAPDLQAVPWSDDRKADRGPAAALGSGPLERRRLRRERRVQLLGHRLPREPEPLGHPPPAPSTSSRSPGSK